MTRRLSRREAGVERRKFVLGGVQPKSGCPGVAVEECGPPYSANGRFLLDQLDNGSGERVFG